MTINKIRKYSLLAFALPLIAINTCWFLYANISKVDAYAPIDWDFKTKTFSINEFRSSFEHKEGEGYDKYTLLTCPRTNPHFIYKSSNKIYSNDSSLKKVFTSDDWDKEYNLAKKKNINLDFWKIIEERNIEEIEIIYIDKSINNICVRNHKILFFVFDNFNFIEKFFISARKNNTTGWIDIKNPYFYGEASISRTARDFPFTLIFKPLIILSAIFLFLFWRNNYIFFKQTIFKYENKINYRFFYYGSISCIFLILHAIFLGFEINSVDPKNYAKFRRSILLFFIFFEVFAQTSLALTFHKYKDELKSYIKSSIVKTKFIFVSIIYIVTIALLIIINKFEINYQIKNILEWNYFSILLLYYLINRIMWKETKYN
jgi:hypothetical protein